MSPIFKLPSADELFDPFLSLLNRCPVLSTPTDWKETPESHVFTADLPGLTKEQVKVEVVDDGDGGKVLQISGDRGGGDEESGEEKSGGWRRVERCRGKFCRRFRLPENANGEEVKAWMVNGVLTVTVGKKEVKKPEKKVVEIQTV